MEFKQAMRIWKRMCKMQNICQEGAGEHAEEIEAILAKWAEEHPEKTIADDFFEKFPNAPRDDANNPYPCAKDCGYSKPPYCEHIPNCVECWRRPLEEAEG